jgi:hypothetical protein
MIRIEDTYAVIKNTRREKPRWLPVDRQEMTDRPLGIRDGGGLVGGGSGEPGL